MSTLDKLIKKVLSDRTITYQETEKILLKLGFSLAVTSSHHIFRKKGYPKTISIKKRKELLLYQVKEIKQVLYDHGY